MRPALISRFAWCPTLCGVLLLAVTVLADTAGTNSPLLSVQRIYGSSEFDAESAPVRWLDDGSGYTTWESSVRTSGGRDLVRHDPATGATNIDRKSVV